MPELSIHFDALDPGLDEEERLLALLDAGERDRAATFRFARDRRRFVVRRGRLRERLAQAMGRGADALRFESNGFGKPIVADGPHFSLSHSGDRMMLAIGDAELGCDIERIDPALDWRPLARQFFADEENDLLRALPDDAALRGFFTCWSRKEAFVKALGVGLARPLDSFVVSVNGDARLLSGGEGWALRDVEPPEGFCAALAVKTVWRSAA